MTQYSKVNDTSSEYQLDKNLKTQILIASVTGCPV